MSCRTTSRRKSFFLALTVIAWSAPVFILAQTTATLNEGLPAGAMQQKATTACLECHEARIILQQRLNKAAWAKDVDKMMKWGAVMDASDRDPLIDYLSVNFSPDKPAYIAPHTSRISGKSIGR